MNKNGQPVPFGARGLEELETITDTYVIPELKECEFRIACDVTNTLCGEQGASAVYGPQKGATLVTHADGLLIYLEIGHGDNLVLEVHREISINIVPGCIAVKIGR